MNNTITDFNNNNNINYKDGNYAEIKKFSNDDIPERATAMIFSGPTHSGKTIACSRLISDMYKNGVRWKTGYLFSSTADVTNSFNFIPPKHRYSNFNRDTLANIFTKNKDTIKKGLKKGIPLFSLKKSVRTLVICDDLGYGNRRSDSMSGFSMTDPILEMAFCQSRHSSVDFLIIVHSCYATLSPKCRKNASLVFNFPTCNYSEMQGLILENGIRNYFKMNEARKLINGLFQQKPFLCCVSTNWKVDKKDYRDLMSWWVAPDIDKLDNDLGKIKFRDKPTQESDDEDEDDSIFKKIKKYNGY